MKPLEAIESGKSQLARTLIKELGAEYIGAIDNDIKLNILESLPKAGMSLSDDTMDNDIKKSFTKPDAYGGTLLNTIINKYIEAKTPEEIQSGLAAIQTLLGIEGVEAPANILNTAIKKGNLQLTQMLLPKIQVADLNKTPENYWYSKTVLDVAVSQYINSTEADAENRLLILQSLLGVAGIEVPAELVRDTISNCRNQDQIKSGRALKALTAMMANPGVKISAELLTQ